MTTSDPQLEDQYWLALSQIKKIGPISWQKIINYFPSLEAAWQASAEDFKRAGLEEKLISYLISQRPTLNPEAELSKLLEEKINLIKITDPNYPRLLKEIYNPPAILYYRGSLDSLTKPTIAIVGTRKNSSYGRQVAEEIGGQLARAGLTIVSGLALGIDALAHLAAINHQEPTAAVLGSGLDWQNIYPATNRQLAQKIIDGQGIVLSELSLGTMPTKFTFPLRNRIISGLSLGTIVIEAPESSGALITAKYALEQNREVFAIPGSIYNRLSVGANNLIKAGAKLVNCHQDILEELNIKSIDEKISPLADQPHDSTELIILNLLSKEPLHIDKIAIFSKLKINSLMSALTLLEMKGLIKDLGGKNYIKLI
ncbi:MAG TPA: DNA-processing protein DprA [bacterium]|mgnify:CR=1 FL=1|nr:DNA-processing protein DprA [bacterium]HOH67180.1 DNA-processing protein DprA [bacterium]